MANYEFLQHAGKLSLYRGTEIGGDINMQTLQDRLFKQDFSDEAKFNGNMTKEIDGDPSLKHEHNIFIQLRHRLPHYIYMNPAMLLFSIRLICDSKSRMPSDSKFREFFKKETRFKSEVAPDFLRYTRVIYGVLKDTKIECGVNIGVDYE